jgi:predicted dehydrogenase
MVDRVKVAVVGCGRISRAHIPRLKASERFEIVGVADVNEDAARSRAEEFGVPRWEKDYRAFTAEPDVDAIWVLTPAAVHAEVAISALRAGKHVFCEKPMARTVSQGKAMADAAAEGGKVLLVGYVMRHSPDALNLRKLIRDGRIGRPVFYRDIWALAKGNPSASVHDRELGGGIIYEHAHWLDFVSFVFGPAKKVYASTMRFKPDPTTADDTFIAVIHFQSGDQAVWSESWAALGLGWEPIAVGRRMRPVLDIIGPEGSIHFPGPDGEKVLSLYESKDQDAAPTEQWEWEQDWGANAVSFDNEHDHFYRCVREGSEPNPLPEEALGANILAEAVMESSRTGSPVHLA